jgi:Ca2+-binding EF-hand superfamily protein
MTDLRFLLKNQGDKLDSDQVEEIMNRLPSRNGVLHYKDVVNQFSN